MNTATIWHKQPEAISCDPHFLPWLTKPYVISKTMQQICKHLTIKILYQQITTALTEEQAYLNISPNNKCFIRQVYLLGDAIIWSYGRVIAPLETYLANKEALDNLNNKAIGETLLYNNNAVSRSCFEYARLTPNNILHQLAKVKLSATSMQKNFWARRSCFYINNLPLAIIEIYLPNIPQYPKLKHNVI